jgi:hypothetical protein
MTPFPLFLDIGFTFRRSTKKPSLSQSVQMCQHLLIVFRVGMDILDLTLLKSSLERLHAKFGLAIVLA